MAIFKHNHNTLIKFSTWMYIYVILHKQWTLTFITERKNARIPNNKLISCPARLCSAFGTILKEAVTGKNK